MKPQSITQKLLSVTTAFSLLLSCISPVSAAKAPAEAKELENFKSGWSYAVNVTANTPGELDVSDWDTVTLPAGNAKDSSPLCKDYLEQNGTTVGETGNTPNLVFQKTVTVNDIDNCAGFAMDAVVDDGAVVFVNGKLALRLNAKPDGEGTSDTRIFGYKRRYVINDPLGQVNKSHFDRMFIDKSLFKNGENTVTVAILQDSATSSDILFDGMMYAIPAGYADSTPSGAGFDRGSEWLWIKNDREDSWLSDSFIPLGTDETEYNSYSWRKSNAPFGYNTEDNSKPVTVTTAIPHPAKRDANAYPSDVNHLTGNVYFRRTVNIESLDFDALTVNIYRVRNVTVYVNGNEVLRTTDGTNNDMRTDTVVIPSDKFKVGANVISVDLANSADTSSCLYFDAELIFGKRFTAKAFAMTPGKNETEMGFMWHTVPGSADSSALQLAETAEYKANGFTAENTLSVETNKATESIQSNSVTATGLKRGTEYTYRYGDPENDLWSEISTFRTGSADRNKIIYTGDPTIGGEAGLDSTRKAWNANLAAAESKAPDATLILTGGDNANDQDIHYEYLKEADQFKRLPYASTVGNHETPAFRYNFTFPNLTAYGNTEKGSDYYFSYGNTLYIMINAFSQNVPQHKKAMQEAIASHSDAKWKVVITHFDIYGAGPHASGRFDYYRTQIQYLRKNLAPVYDELGIDIVLNGHDHSYCRSHFMYGQQPQLTQITDENGAFVNPNGTLFITASCGSNGRFYSPEVNKKMNWVNVAKDYQEPQFTLLDITDDTFTISTHLASDTDKILDTVTIRKDADNNKIPLRDAIASAKQKLNDTEHPQAAGDTFKKTIEAAEAILANLSATEEQIRLAVSEISTAAETFEAQSAKYTVTYDANGGTGNAPTEADKFTGESFTVLPNNFIAPYSKQFNGWNTAANGSGKMYAPGDTITVSGANITLYACWKDISKAPGATKPVTVKKTPKVTKVTVKRSGKAVKKTIKISKKKRYIKLKAVVSGKNLTAKYKKVKWYSNKKKIATVKNGKVTFKKKGTVKIMVKTVKGNKKATVTIKIR